MTRRDNVVALDRRVLPRPTVISMTLRRRSRNAFLAKRSPSVRCSEQALDVRDMSEPIVFVEFCEDDLREARSGRRVFFVFLRHWPRTRCV